MSSSEINSMLLVGLGVSLGFIATIATSAIADRTGETPLVPVQTGEIELPGGTVQGTTQLGELVDDETRRTPVVDAVARVAPSVVSITTEVASQSLFRRGYGGSTEESEGSGVVIDEEGVVLTNAHVVEQATRITATLPDGSTYGCKVIGLASELDLAVLRLINAEDLTAVEIGSSADLMLGEPVIAIGNPFGLGHTVTTGVVSHPSRPIATDNRVYQDFIQTDASINPGNSGGPLLNAHGHLIGINTSIRANAEGIGFAIPVDRAIKVAHDIMAYGMVQIPWLGVDLEDVRVSSGRSSAILPQVRSVDSEGPALDAGLQSGDLLLQIDERTLQGRADLNSWLAAFEPGASVTLHILRGNDELEVELDTMSLPDTVIDRSLNETMGIQVTDAGSAVQIVRLRNDSLLARRGVRVGDRITDLNGLSITSVEDLRLAVASAKSGHRGSALLTIRRGHSVGRIQVDI